MPHEYSNFKNKNILYAKVNRRVFGSLFNAEEYCTANGLNVNSAIEYGEDQALKDAVQEIARYQKAILYEVMVRIDALYADLKKQIERDKTSLQTCHPLEQNYCEQKLHETIAMLSATYAVRKTVWTLVEELEGVTGWHD